MGNDVSIWVVEQMMLPKHKRLCLACEGSGRVYEKVCALCCGCGMYDPDTWLRLFSPTRPFSLVRILQHRGKRNSFWHRVDGALCDHARGIWPPSNSVRVAFGKPHVEIAKFSKEDVPAAELCIACWPSFRNEILAERRALDPLAEEKRRLTAEKRVVEIVKDGVSPCKMAAGGNGERPLSCYTCGRAIAVGAPTIALKRRKKGKRKGLYLTLHLNCYGECFRAKK
jgi:hypothetical protein